MAENKRYTIQILATADAGDSLTLHAAIVSALKAVPSCEIKAVNLDMWTDGHTGKARSFNANGEEILETPKASKPQI